MREEGRKSKNERDMKKTEEIFEKWKGLRETCARDRLTDLEQHRRQERKQQQQQRIEQRKSTTRNQYKHTILSPSQSSYGGGNLVTVG